MPSDDVMSIPDRMRRLKRLRALSLVLLLLLPVGLGLARAAIRRDDTVLAGVAAALAAAGLVGGLGLRWWTDRESRALLVLQGKDIEAMRPALEAAAGGRPVPDLPGPADHGPVLGTPVSDAQRRAMQRRSWMLFGFALLLVVLAESAWRRGDTVLAATFGVACAGALVFAMVLRRRHREGI
ncbi:MAG TPA: hypothetical protein VFH47_00880 [Candidatus Thermoplasmatota archaeon]|nr:hypothetical protein [Candidatus Thermoplasmatota archaeon]